MLLMSLSSFLVFFFSMLLLISLSSFKLTPPILSPQREGMPDLSRLFPRQERQEAFKDIKLLATSSGSRSLALLEIDGVPRVVRIGSEVGPYRVISIRRNSVELSDGRNSLTVSFRFESAPQSQSPSASSPGSNVVSKSELERITADPGIMFRQIRLVPYVENGRTVGFIFEWVDPSSIFARMGINAGDILLSINNMQIQSGEDAFRILQTLRNESSLRAEIIRNGQKQTLQVRIE